MARDFEGHCWQDIIDADTIAIYQAYRRKTYVGDNPAAPAIDLYDKAYQGGNRPVRSTISHKVNLFDLHHKYADVMHIEEVLAQLDGLAVQRKVA